MTKTDAPAKPKVGLITIQFGWGGLLDTKPVDDVIHLNANYAETSSYTLCGLALFGDKAPGWSRGGGVTGPNLTHVACPTCRVVVNNRYPDETVSRGMFDLDWSKP